MAAANRSIGPGKFGVLPRAAILSAIACLCLLPAIALAEDRLVLLDGAVVTTVVTAISDSGKIASDDAAHKLDLSALRSIERPAASASGIQPAVRVVLAGGGIIQAESAILHDDVCKIDWAYGKQLSLPIDAVRGLRFSSGSPKSQPKGHEAFDAAADQPGDRDQLFLIVADGIQAISGIFEDLSADELVFNWQDKRQSVPRAKVFGLVIAPVGKRPAGGARGALSLADGSTVLGRVIKLESGKLFWQTAAGFDLTFPWEAVAKITVANDRLVYLSDMQPIAVEQQPLVTFARSWRRDQSVLGKPLTLGDKTFPKGLGVHSRCGLSFANEGFDLFAATVGIDAETRGKGDCVFVVLGDGRELLRHRVRGVDKSADIRLTITGVKTIVLLVEPGEDLDLADHGDWCDARLVRDSDTKPAAAGGP